VIAWRALFHIYCSPAQLQAAQENIDVGRLNVVRGHGRSDRGKHRRAQLNVRASDTLI
jgi:hypothetical protein